MTLAPSPASVSLSQSQTKRMKKRRELDALMKLGRNGSLSNGSSFNKDSSSLLIRSSQSSTDEDEEEEIQSNPQRARRNGGTVVATKPQSYSNNPCTLSFICSTFVFTACLLLCVYLMWNLMSMQHRYDDLSTRMLKLETEVNTNIDALAKLTQTVQPLLNQLNNVSQQTSKNFVSLSGLKSDLANTQQSLSELSQLSSIEERFTEFKSNLASNVNSLEIKISELENNQNQISSSSLDTQTEAIGDLNHRLEGLKSQHALDMDSEQSKISEMWNLFAVNVSSIESKLKNVSADITALKEQVRDQGSKSQQSSTDLEYSRPDLNGMNSQSSEANQTLATARATPHSPSTNTTTSVSDYPAQKELPKDA